MVTITQNELNQLYLLVNKAYVEGRISNLTDVVFSTSSNQPVLFRWDTNLKNHRKQGAWVVKGSIQIIFPEDEKWDSEI